MVADVDDELADLFERAPVGYAVCDRAGVVVRANAEFRRLTARDDDALVGAATLPSLLSVGGRIYFETHLAPMLGHDGSVREVALDVVRPDGGRVPVLLNADLDEADGLLRVCLVETRDRHRYEQDLLRATGAADDARRAAAALANTLQQTLIPPAPPRIPGLVISAVYRPAGDGTTVGGDFFDVFKAGAEHWYVVVGDVSGKGPLAAAVTSFVRYTVRALAIDHPDPAELLRHLDHGMAAHGSDHYCTLAVAVLSRSGGRWSVQLVLAGHPPALVRHRDGRVTELGAFGSPVGLVEEPRFTTVHHVVGDETITLYTDGVTEARGRDGLFGEARLHRLLHDLPGDPDALTRGVAHEALAFQTGVASDDIAIVAFAAEHPPSGQDD